MEKSQRGDVKDCRTGMLSWWLQHGTQRRWTSIVRAVEGIKMEPLARKIATKYGRFISQTYDQLSCQLLFLACIVAKVLYMSEMFSGTIFCSLYSRQGVAAI